jgi:transcriptional regulator with XRE-family HTH domain
MQRTQLKLLRIKHGFTQEKMAVRLGYSRNQYQRIENGEQGVTLKFLVALSNAFGKTIEEAKELTKRDDEKKESDRETC